MTEQTIYILCCLSCILFSSVCTIIVICINIMSSRMGRMEKEWES